MPSWRPLALQILRELNYDGHVFIPEPEDGQWLANYDVQIEWEEEGLHRADSIVFWVPREHPHMSGLTTNVEWGEWKDSGKVLLGTPYGAQNVRYLQYYAQKLGVPVEPSLRPLLHLAVERLGPGALREGGEGQVPLHIWERPEFQAWLSDQREIGGKLEGARVKWTLYPSPGTLYCFALEVSLANEQPRVLLFHPYLPCVVLHKQQPI